MADDSLEVMANFARGMAKKLPLDSGNYPYVCARVKAKKSMLYAPEIYQRLLNMTVPQIARTLGEGEYREEMLSLGAKYEGFDLVAMATRDNLVRVYNQILAFSEGELRDVLSMFLGKWDVWNIETILRGKFYGARLPEMMEELIPAGTCPLPYLRGLAERETVDDVVDALEGNLYQRALQGALDDYHRLGSVAPLEDALYHEYYRLLLETVSPASEPKALLLSHIRSEIDMVNLRTLLRLSIQDPGPADGYFIEGGAELGVSALGQMARAGWDATLAGLRDCSFFATIGADLSGARESGLNDAMRALDRHSLRESARHANLHPLSVLPVLDYILAKKNEVDNIRAIVRGKEYGLGNDVIRSLLIVG